VASMGHVAASGGYYVSCAADEIMAHPNTITGSIGVTGMIPDVSGLTDKLGIRSETVNTAPSADIGSPFRSPTDAELGTIQAMVDRVYEVFLDRVAEGRGMTRDEVHGIAQGRVWSGRDAKENGLVDAFGSFEDALNRAASLANLEEGWTVSVFDAEPDEFDLLLAALIAEGVTLPRSRGILASMMEQANALPEIPTRARVMMRMPWDLVIR
jgi:protease-4